MQANIPSRTYLEAKKQALNDANTALFPNIVYVKAEIGRNSYDLLSAGIWEVFRRGMQAGTRYPALLSNRRLFVYLITHDDTFGSIWIAKEPRYKNDQISFDSFFICETAQKCFEKLDHLINISEYD